jgi:hypothetical protein
MLRRRHFHIDEGYTWVMCNLGSEEDIFHHFFDCLFATSCWQTLQMLWPDDQDIHAKLSYGRTHSASGFFIEIFLVATWELWNLRNNKIFNKWYGRSRLWIANFKKQVLFQLLRVKAIYHPHIVQWLDTIV